MPKKPTRRKPTEEELEQSRERTLHCTDCNILFATTAPNVKRCRGCRAKRLHRRNKPEMKTCDYCGDEYETTRSWSRFCCDQHRNAYHRERYEEDLLKGKE